MSTIEELERRLAEQDARLAEMERLAVPVGQAPQPTPHEPRPGTWLAGAWDAVCRYCGERISRPGHNDDVRWLGSDGQEHCQHRANGAPAAS